MQFPCPFLCIIDTHEGRCIVEICSTKTQPPMKTQTTEVPWRKSNFIWMVSNSHASFQMALTVVLNEYDSFLHKWLLGANMAWSSPPSELTPTQYQVANEASPEMMGDSWLRGSQELHVDVLSNGLLNPRLWTASHSDRARKMNSKESWKGPVGPFHWDHCLLLNGF